ncbi:MAG: hypothetical protein DI628_02250 [Blastochloris viridis]|uniref:Uncharacterized protein n=1 Tax=Blastochloris viridis TaxID=1079 RepID=A0A6N4R360_BLAVI|nr:MAG: hypothetical protein DI628_02250 [Blastochloris viridis]
MPTKKHLDCGLEPREKTPSQHVWRVASIAILISSALLAVIVIESNQSIRKVNKPLLKAYETEAHVNPLKTG